MAKKKTIKRDPRERELSTTEEDKIVRDPDELDPDEEECEEEDAMPIIKDGQSIRVPLYMRDGTTNPALTPVQRAIAEHKLVGDQALADAEAAARIASEYIAQAFRDSRTTTKPTATDLAYADYDNDMNSRYLGDAEGREGSPCTVRNEQFPEAFGSPGHIKNGVCVPDRKRQDALSPEDAKAEAYRLYDEEQQNAWRGK